MMIQDSSRIKSIIFAFVILASICCASIYVSVSYKKPSLVNEIEKFENSNDLDESRGMAVAINEHLRLGASIDQARDFFTSAGFQFHEGRRDTWDNSQAYNSIYTSYYSTPIGPKLLNAYKVYRFTLYFQDNELVEVEGKIYNEQP